MKSLQSSTAMKMKSFHKTGMAIMAVLLLMASTVCGVGTAANASRKEGRHNVLGANGGGSSPNWERIKFRERRVTGDAVTPEGSPRCGPLEFFYPPRNACVACGRVCDRENSVVYCYNNCRRAFFAGSEPRQCPVGHFHYAPTNACLTCSSVCGPNQTSDAGEFCQDVCKDSSVRCGPGEFYYPMNTTCIRCDAICRGEKSATPFCRKNCGVSVSSDVCGPNEFYHPPSSGCVSCGVICAPGKSLEYCKRNCPFYEDKAGGCKADEFFYPKNASCIKCADICEPGKNSTFCRRQCPERARRT